MINKVRPDKQKSNSLRKMAEITLERLNKTPMGKYPTNTLLDYYDIIHKLLESLAFREGIKAKGEGAHQELIDFISKQYEFTEQVRRFLQQLRDYRNRISYEGFTINKDYIRSNNDKIMEIINTLLDETKR